MNKNKVWCFLFSFCPGAGQMYQGYMKRGLSHILLFVCIIMIAAVFMPVLLALAAVVYMYSFFDSLNLRAAILAGNAPKDEFPIHFGMENGDLKKLLNGRSNLIGWVLVVLGGAGIYKTVIEGPLFSLLYSLPDGPLYQFLYQLIRGIPNLAFGLLFIAVGLWLVDCTFASGITYRASKVHPI